MPPKKRTCELISTDAIEKKDCFVVPPKKKAVRESCCEPELVQPLRAGGDFASSLKTVDACVTGLPAGEYTLTSTRAINDGFTFVVRLSTPILPHEATVATVFQNPTVSGQDKNRILQQLRRLRLPQRFGLVPDDTDLSL